MDNLIDGYWIEIIKKNKQGKIADGSFHSMKDEGTVFFIFNSCQKP